MKIDRETITTIRLNQREATAMAGVVNKVENFRCNASDRLIFTPEEEKIIARLHDGLFHTVEVE